MQFDRKLILIAPTFVLAFVVAGLLYASAQLRVLSSVGETWKERNDFITAVERGQRPLDQRQAVSILRLSLDVEAKRTAAINAAYDLLLALAVIAGVCCVALADGVRRIPREHWPRFGVH